MSRRGAHRHTTPLPVLLVAIVAALLSLGSVVRTLAMPVEARTSEPWYGYTSTVSFDWEATVRTGRFYDETVQRPEQLIRIQGAVEPPVYKRILVTRYTDELIIRIPYFFHADRPANLKGQFRVDGTMVIPGLWQKSITFVPPKEVSAQGTELNGMETFTIQIANVLTQMEQDRTQQVAITAEPVEFHIKPVFEVTADGLKQPVQDVNTPEFLVTVRSMTVEVDDQRAVKNEKSFTETHIVPIMINIFGRQVSVVMLRQMAIIAAVFFLALSALMLWNRQRKTNDRDLLLKLGPNLVSARAFELPPGTAVVDVRSAKELLQLQIHSERPVIRVGEQYYLLDGTTCYRLVLSLKLRPTITPMDSDAEEQVAASAEPDNSAEEDKE